ncbi:MAG: aa3-type cytochrome oxidase subunit III [Acidimicrobiales bacterium]
MTLSTAAPVGKPRETRPPLLAVGAVVWLASELMFFSGLFAAYFTMRSTARGPWPPEGVELNARVAGLFTAVLVLSSITVQLAVRAIARDDRVGFRRWMAVTVVLAAAFLVNQWHEWDSATFTIGSHTFGSSFFLMTGFHGLHVLGGVLAMFLLLGRSASPRFGAADTPAVEVVGYYWHFVDVVWVALYATLFLLR